MKLILIAGIGNIFLGDDGFGCEVTRQLSSRVLPPEVTVKDFGIRSYDLAYALVEKYDLIILVDAAPRGTAPGTTYLLEIDPALFQTHEEAIPDAHTMNPVSALKMAQSVGSVTARLYLVGCEPKTCESTDGQMSLSKPVQQAVPQAIKMIEDFLGREIEAVNNEIEVAA